MDELYRGHAITVTRARVWHAELVELASGVTLPTKATALLHEGQSTAMTRARELIDVYVDGEAGTDRAA